MALSRGECIGAYNLGLLGAGGMGEVYRAHDSKLGRDVANPGLGPAWSPDGRWVYYSTRGGAAATDVVLKRCPSTEARPSP